MMRLAIGVFAVLAGAAWMGYAVWRAAEGDGHMKKWSRTERCPARMPLRFPKDEPQPAVPGGQCGLPKGHVGHPHSLLIQTGAPWLPKIKGAGLLQQTLKSLRPQFEQAMEKALRKEILSDAKRTGQSTRADRRAVKGKRNP